MTAPMPVRQEISPWRLSRNALDAAPVGTRITAVTPAGGAVREWVKVAAPTSGWRPEYDRLGDVQVEIDTSRQVCDYVTARIGRGGAVYVDPVIDPVAGPLDVLVSVEGVASVGAYLQGLDAVVRAGVTPALTSWRPDTFCQVVTVGNRALRVAAQALGVSCEDDVWQLVQDCQPGEVVYAGAWQLGCIPEGDQ